MNNLYSTFGQFQSFMQNPVGYLLQRNINIPKDIAGNPNAIIQQMMNSGQINQQAYNQAQQMARQMQSNPMFMQFFGRR